MAQVIKTEQTVGKLTFLMAQNAPGYGPPNNAIDVDVVLLLDSQPGRGFGFQLRSTSPPANNAMFALLRDAYINNLTVQIDFSYTPPALNGIIFRAALTKLG